MLLSREPVPVFAGSRNKRGGRRQATGGGGAPIKPWPRLSNVVLAPGCFRRRLVLSVLSQTAEGPLNVVQDKSQELAAYIEMTRPINLLPSALLVFVGAWTGSGKNPSALLSGAVWLMSLMSGSIAVASVVVNDYFDWRSGVDGVNAPNKPLPSGVVPPDSALLLSTGLYIATLTAACLMEPPLLRVIIALSACATLIYTPLLKKITWVKNATVAAIIAASPLAGALAAGTGQMGLQRTLAPCLFVFLGVLYREVLMDLNDEAGDRAAHVWTLPVVLGQPAALATATLFWTLATCWGLYSVILGPGLSQVWQVYLSMSILRALAALLFLALTSQGFGHAVTIWRKNFDSSTINDAVDGSMKPIGLGLLLLAAAA